jgi:hypothetical protein
MNTFKAVMKGFLFSIFGVLALPYLIAQNIAELLNDLL